MTKYRKVRQCPKCDSLNTTPNYLEYDGVAPRPIYECNNCGNKFVRKINSRIISTQELVPFYCKSTEWEL